MTGRPETSGAAAILGEVVTAAPDATCTANRHGDNITAYKNYKCRCPAARLAYAVNQKKHRTARTRGARWSVDATGSCRRLRALAAIGWRADDIAQRLNVDPVQVRHIWWGPERGRQRVYLHTARAIMDVYCELSDTPGPSSRAAQYAQRKGWQAPIWWDDDTIDIVEDKDTNQKLLEKHIKTDVDEVAVDRYLAGDTTISLRRDEKRAAFTRLIAAGCAPNAAGKRLGINGQYAAQYARDAEIDVGVARDDAPMTHNPRAVA